MAEKTKEIKERKTFSPFISHVSPPNQVRGLEPDIQRLVAKQREEVRRLEAQMRDDARRELASERTRAQREMARLQEAAGAERVAAVEKEREA